MNVRPLATRIGIALAVMLSTGVLAAARAQTRENFQIYVSNERSADVTIIDGNDLRVVGIIPVGKRPRGIHASADGKTVYVTLSGTPIAVPHLDTQGNPMFQPGKSDDDERVALADKAADGIGVIDVAQHKLTGKLLVGSDPEEFSVSRSGTQLYVSNEDAKSASVVNLATGKIEHVVEVGQEPEGVATAPDGKSFYVTCEAGGEIFVIDASSYKVIGRFSVAPRPRSVDFLRGTSIAFIPSESVGQLNVVDTSTFKVIKTITLPPGSRPMSVKVAPDGKKVYISNGRAGTVSVLDAHSYALLDNIQVGTRPWGMVIAPDGKYLYTANGPSNDVSVVDLKTDKEIAKVQAGESPWGVAIVAGAH